MTDPLAIALLVILAYALGSIPSAYIVGRLARGIDIRTVGSRNPGALNTLREVGAAAAVVVLVADTLKGALAIPLSIRKVESPWACLYDAIGVVAGHNWSVFLRFRGGKGAATVLGVSLAVLPWFTLITLGPAAIVALLTRNVVLGVVIGFVVLNILVVATGQELSQVLICLLLAFVVMATYLGRSWHQTLAAVRRGRLLDLFSFK